MIRIGVDVGGTFTDVVVLDETSGSTSWLKLPTNELAPADGVLDAIGATGVDCAEISHVKLGTTLGVNAIITRTGAPTGVITTRGFRDVLEIRRTCSISTSASPTRWSRVTCDWRCRSASTPTAM
jgi:N-methylhydantoinase A